MDFEFGASSIFVSYALANIQNQRNLTPRMISSNYSIVEFFTAVFLQSRILTFLSLRLQNHSELGQVDSSMKNVRDLIDGVSSDYLINFCMRWLSLCCSMCTEGKKLEKYRLIADFKHKQQTKSVGGNLVVYYKCASLFDHSPVCPFSSLVTSFWRLES